jgi:hypothetical protein
MYRNSIGVVILYGILITYLCTMFSWDISYASPTKTGLYQQMCDDISTITGAISPIDKIYRDQITVACNSSRQDISLSGSITTIGSHLFDIKNPIVFRSVVSFLPRHQNERVQFRDLITEHEADFRRRIWLDPHPLSQTLLIRYVHEMYIKYKGTPWVDPWAKELKTLIESWNDSLYFTAPYIDTWAFMDLGMELSPPVSSDVLDQGNETLIGDRSLKKQWSLKQTLKFAEWGDLIPFEKALEDHNRQYTNNQNGSIINFLYYPRFIDAFEKYPNLIETRLFNDSDKTLIKNVILLRKFTNETPKENRDISDILAGADQIISLLQSPRYTAWGLETPSIVLDILSKTLYNLAKTHLEKVVQLFTTYPQFFEHGIMLDVRNKVIQDSSEIVSQKASPDIQQSINTNNSIFTLISTLNPYQRGIIFSIVIFIFLISLYAIIWYLRKS